MSKILEICQQVNVIPVLVIDDLASARPLAEALVAGGLPVLEVTLRTPVALEAIRIMAAVPGSVVGAGTVLNARDVDAVKAAGAEFIVSPGATPELVQAAQQAGLPLLPGAATASEVMSLLAQGFDMLKFFPAEAAGGTGMLKSWAGPLASMKFCPTGGISPANAANYLGLPNVVCVGGSWVAPTELVRAGRWAEITALAAECANLTNKKAVS